ncbi:MAG: TRAP transporter small permease [Rubritepida sp.]|nr:TRAP transporter small permease [Rubritepida sp.]
MNAMNALPLQVTAAATLAAVALALWAGQGDGPRAALRRGVLALDRASTGFASVLAVGALAVAVAAGAWQVVARFATETPSIWSEALVRTALIWMAYVGLAVAIRTGALVSIDLLRSLARGGLRRAVDAAILAFSLSLLGVMFWFGWHMAERVKFQEMAGLEVSMAWGYAAIPIGAVFAMVGALAHFFDQRHNELETAV